MRRPWMPLYVGDYLADTRHLSTIEHGAYFLLILHYWQRGGLPDDDVQLARIVGVDFAQWEEIKPTLSKLFQPGWRHKRIDAEIAKCEQRVAAGRKGGMAKAAKQNPGKRPSKRLAKSWQTAWQTPSEPVVVVMDVSPTDTQSMDDGGGGDARARAKPDKTDLGKPSDQLSPAAQARSLAAEIAAIAGYPDPQLWPPGWCGAPLRVQAWLAEPGWTPEIILAACREVMARKRDGPPDSVSYFERPIARAVARSRAPLPQIESGKVVSLQQGGYDVVRRFERQSNGDRILAGVARALSECADSQIGARYRRAAAGEPTDVSGHPAQPCANAGTEGRD